MTDYFHRYKEWETANEVAVQSPVPAGYSVIVSIGLPDGTVLRNGIRDGAGPMGRALEALMAQARGTLVQELVGPRPEVTPEDLPA